MILQKAQYWIERIPWYVFSVVIFFFLYKLYSNAGSFHLVLINLLGITCFTYLAAHNSILQPAKRLTPSKRTSKK
jgi:hypothetical protein